MSEPQHVPGEPCDCNGLCGYEAAAPPEGPGDLDALVAALEHANVVIGELRARLDAAPLTVAALVAAMMRTDPGPFLAGVSLVHDWATAIIADLQEAGSS